MTRKQYRGKMMQLQRNIAVYGKQIGKPLKSKSDRIGTPIWGSVIHTGMHKGEKLTSYKQSWDCICEVLKGTDLMKGIEV